MAVIIQTALSGTNFDGTANRGFVDLAGGQGVDAVNEGRRFVISYLSVNCPVPGMLSDVRVVLALNKAGADGIDHFRFEVKDTNAQTEWTLRGPIVVPNLYSLFVFATQAGPDSESRLQIFGGILSRIEGFDF